MECPSSAYEITVSTTIVLTSRPHYRDHSSILAAMKSGVGLMGAPSEWWCIMSESEQIREAGLKVTVPRAKILAILERNAKRHMSAEDVFRELLAEEAEIGLATVYRVLTQFESAGLVCRRNFDNAQSVFELNRGEHHDHLVCTRCGGIVEFADPRIEERRLAVAEDNGFLTEDHSLIIYGICPACRQDIS